MQVGSWTPFNQKQVKAPLTLEPTEKQTYPRFFSNSDLASLPKSKNSTAEMKTELGTSNF